MVDFTVAIPTYNGANRLPELLERLGAQIHTENFSWEIIIVDNNSTDRTAQVVRDYQGNWHCKSPLLYCFEAEQGAAFARARGVREASGELVGFLDDDTIPEYNWVASAYKFGQEHPAVGAYGSQIHGEFEVEPPENFDKIKLFLAIIERGATAYQYEPRKRVLPPSAGLVVRRQAWLESVPSRLYLQGRTPHSMLGGEDIEAMAYIQLAGWEIWYNPEMEVNHKIPKERLQRDYLLALARGIGLSRHPIRMVRTMVWLRGWIIPIYLVNDLRKVIVHFIKYRSVMARDIGAACEMEYYWGTLLSPFYLWIEPGSDIALAYSLNPKSITDDQS
ncbi:hormogonium polysaccharide biosynthesis glycosyltransferase HpsE [Limnofasciculus baicalensis]|nr:hormogonium polysaccharide biosynthesis glycosyltransferase HpsE [Limnofasciculus baicalensis]